MQQVKIKKINIKAQIPNYSTTDSAGMDLVSLLDENIMLQPGERAIVPTGIGIELPKGFEAQIRPRSGLAFKNGITVLNSPGTIDADYRGEIKVLLINHSDTAFEITSGMRIAQMVVAKYERVEWSVAEDLSDSRRGEGGFGSTGVEAKNVVNQ